MKKIITLLTSKSILKSVSLALWLCVGNMLTQPVLLQAIQTPIIDPALTEEDLDIENLTKKINQIGNNIDFEVRALGNRRFMVSFINKDSRVYIRIYDVIGNLIKEDNTTQRGRFSQEYDMSKSKSEVYIVEVGDTKYSTTKRIFLN
jgi:hypothetical protein